MLTIVLFEMFGRLRSYAQHFSLSFCKNKFFNRSFLKLVNFLLEITSAQNSGTILFSIIYVFKLHHIFNHFFSILKFVLTYDFHRAVLDRFSLLGSAKFALKAN